MKWLFGIITLATGLPLSSHYIPSRKKGRRSWLWSSARLSDSSTKLHRRRAIILTTTSICRSCSVSSRGAYFRVLRALERKMGEFRRFSRRPNGSPFPRSLVLAAFLCITGMTSIFLIMQQGLIWSSRKCPAYDRLADSVAPDVMFVALIDSHTASRSVKGLSQVDFGGQTCVFRMYTSDLPEFQSLSSTYRATCIGHRNGCSVEVRYARGLRMWGDIALQDVSRRTTVIFIRHGITFSTRALNWIKLAHRGISDFYVKGGRRDYAGAVVGCHGEKSLTPWWAHSVGPLNTTCAFSPVREGREDPWAFFATWFAGRRREWVSWPHIWNEEQAVPTFWKGKSKAKRDRNLIRFGTRNGMDYSFLGNPYLLWERWFPRWAANYTMRVVSAESNMGVTFDWNAPSAEGDMRIVHSGKHLNSALATRHGDIVSLGSLWYEPVDAAFGQGYFNALKMIVSQQPEMVSLTIVNSKFLELTRSWLCNVKGGGFIPPNIFWISLDQESREALDAAGVGQTVDITDALAGDNMDAVDILYGQPAYWRLMLMRTRLIRDLLDRGIDVFLFETDQVWLQDPFKYIQQELHAGSDMVGTLDTQHNVAGNTLLLRSVLSTRRMWSEVYFRFKRSYDFKEIESLEKHSDTFVQHDQHHLSSLLLFDLEFTREFPVALGLLSAQLFVGGSWYSGMYGSDEAKRPVIINNNFISGTERKKSRAIVFGHWFLQEDGLTCDVVAVKKALNYKFARLPGNWWAEEQPHMPS